MVNSDAELYKKELLTAIWTAEMAYRSPKLFMWSTSLRWICNLRGQKMHLHFVSDTRG
jgi:hypothetical protein